jgi:hypothetical protein
MIPIIVSGFILMLGSNGTSKQKRIQDLLTGESIMLRKQSSTVQQSLIFTFSLIGLCTATTSTASIINGQFVNHFGSWALDTDGWGSPLSGLNDFSITQQATSNNTARVEIDYYKIAGDITSDARDEAIFANTLYQPLNLTITNNQRWNLSFDWTFDGENAQFDDNFMVGIGDSNGSHFNQGHDLGSLLSPASYGSGHFETLLDNRYNNVAGWYLEFQLNSGTDGFGSYITIDNVNLTMQPAPSTVPIPGAFWLFGSTLVTLIGVKARFRKQ